GTDVDEDLEAKMLPVMRRLRAIWRQGQRPATIAPSTTNPFDPLLTLLSEDASSRNIRLRDHIGPATAWNIGALIGAVTAEAFAAAGINVQNLMSQIGLSPLQMPRIAEMVFGTTSSLFAGGFAQADDNAPNLAVDYIESL